MPLALFVASTLLLRLSGVPLATAAVFGAVVAALLAVYVGIHLLTITSGWFPSAGRTWVLAALWSTMVGTGAAAVTTAAIGGFGMPALGVGAIVGLVSLPFVRRSAIEEYDVGLTVALTGALDERRRGTGSAAGHGDAARPSRPRPGPPGLRRDPARRCAAGARCARRRAGPPGRDCADTPAARRRPRAPERCAVRRGLRSCRAPEPAGGDHPRRDGMGRGARLLRGRRQGVGRRRGGAGPVSCTISATGRPIGRRRRRESGADALASAGRRWPRSGKPAELGDKSGFGPMLRSKIASQAFAVALADRDGPRLVSPRDTIRELHDTLALYPAAIATGGSGAARHRVDAVPRGRGAGARHAGDRRGASRSAPSWRATGDGRSSRGLRTSC